MPPKDMLQWTVDPMDAPIRPEEFEIRFENKVPVKLEYKDDGEVWQSRIHVGALLGC